jgi:diketogulonate reductase-like aldo/keto reductase
VGVAIKEMEDEVPRNELFVTTKVSSGFLDARRKIDVSLEKLGLEYVDL